VLAKVSSNSTNRPLLTAMQNADMKNCKYRWCLLLTMTAVNDKRVVLSLERVPHIDKTATVSSSKNLVLSPRWGLTPRVTGRLAVDWNVTLTWKSCSWELL
jgi:hypothetical protein